MKTKEFTIGVTKSRSFQSYKCEETCILEEGDDLDESKARVRARCRKAVMEEIALDMKKGLK